MKIAIGSDQHGFEYKELIKTIFPQHEYTDVGAHDTQAVSYPEYAKKVADLVASGACQRGILICGTGIGMAISANKVKGCYAAVGHDIYSTERSILSNNCNILCMGALVIGKKTCEEMTKLWLSLEFDTASASASKVAQMRALEGC